MADDEALASSDSDNCKEYIIDVPPLDCIPDERGLGWQYFDYMKKYGDRIAQYIEDTDEEDTYKDLLVRCIRVAISLKSRGLTRGDVVTLCSKNHKDSCVPFIACLFLGIPVSSLDPMLSALDTTHLLKEVRPKVLFVELNSMELIDSCLREADMEAEVIVFGEIEYHTSFVELLIPHGDESEFVPEPLSSLEETAIIIFSSGTTGLPKGIMISHYALLIQCHMLAESENVGGIVLSYATLYWISAVLFLSVMTYIGGARVICSKFDPRQTWLLLEKYQIQTIFAPPSQLAVMIACGRPENLDTSKLHSCITGGAVMPEKLMREIRDLLPGTFVFQMYGQSEVAGVIAMFSTNNVRDILLLDSKTNSVGKIVAGISCKVVNPDTDELCGPNTSGELRLKSKFLMKGYYGRDSSESYDSDGWLRTGDVVYYDEDRCFYIIDRIKEMLKYKSWHVAPAMIEQILMNHPAVNKSVVIGIPHETDGDHPLAVVVLNRGYANVAEHDIADYVATRVPDRMKLRGGVKFSDHIPMTPSGKVKRRELRDMILDGKL